MRLLLATFLTTLLLVANPLAGAEPAQEVNSQDREDILAAALDYGEGWYEADADRMLRALHPERAKRMIHTDATTGRSRLHTQGALTLVNNTRAGGGSDVPVGSSHSAATILDVFANAASDE